MGAGALWMLSLGELMSRRAYGAPITPSPYGPISPKLDQSTGLPLLQLPEGFRYSSFSWTGDLMSDGVLCPGLHDGMAVIDEFHRDEDLRDDDEALFGCFDDDERRHFFANNRNRYDEWYRFTGSRWDGRSNGRNDSRYDNRYDNRQDSRYDRGYDRHEDDGRSGRLILCRNHEQDVGAPYLNKPSITYLPDGAGGNVNLIFNPRKGEWEKDYSTLAGTIRNCAGGVTPWGTWLTSEETGVAGHGWNFEVGRAKGSPIPLTEMGRFSHEALMVDPRTGWVYETEDSNDCGFYRFIPNSRGRLRRGGKLYMLTIKGQPNIDLGVSFPIGTTWDVDWVRIDDPLAVTQSCFAQGSAKGGAKFRRLEGCWWGDRYGYFLSTDGGVVREGQVFEYDARNETLKLIYDAPHFNEVDNPDNMVVTPRGGLLLCEDAAGNHFLEGERLIGLTLEGGAFTFAQNNMDLRPFPARNARVPAQDFRQSEFAGACYSPDGKWLFVNIQTPGVTFAITGPWGKKGPL
jgi:secreted PhoX family phosphatase